MPLLVLLLALLLLPSPALGQEAPEILVKALSAYQNCSAYRDRGRQTVELRVSEPGLPAMKETLEFETLFRRPDAFLFEFRELLEAGAGPAKALDPGDPAERGAVWMVDGVVNSWWTVTDEVEVEQDLEVALSGFRGVTSGLSTFVAALLLPSMRNEYLFSVVETDESVARESVGGRPCFRIRLRMQGEWRSTLWIDEETHLIRRVRQTVSLDDGFQATTVDYEPEGDPSLDDEVFLFDVPADIRGVVPTLRGRVGPYIGALIAAAFAVFLVVMIGVRRPDPAGIGR